MNKKLFGALTPLVLVAACGGTSSASKTVTATVTKVASNSSGAAAPSNASSNNAASERSGQGDATSASPAGPLPYGKSATAGGITITLGPLAPYTPSDSASADSPFAKKQYRKSQVTLVNHSGKALHGVGLVVRASVGNTSVEQVLDSQGQVGPPLSVPILDGRTLSWTIAFPVESGKPLTVHIINLESDDMGTWSGTVK